MQNFSLTETRMKGLLVVEPFYVKDERGYFIKDFEKNIFMSQGLDINIHESFESYSIKNVIRGIHFQTIAPQAKLVRAITGSIYDVVVDLRQDSKTFGEWAGFNLSADNRISLYIPQGFGHAFAVYSESAIVSYKCVGEYSKGSDSGIVWNDKKLNINWEIENPIVSERDSALMTFEQFCKDKINI